MHLREGTDEAAVKLLFFVGIFFSSSNLCQKRMKVLQLGGLMPWQRCCCGKTRLEGGERGIWEGDSLQSARMVYVPIAEISAEALP